MPLPANVTLASRRVLFRTRPGSICERVLFNRTEEMPTDGERRGKSNVPIVATDKPRHRAGTVGEARLYSFM